MMSFLRDRLRQWLGSRLGVHSVRGFTVTVDNTRPDIATADVLARLDESLTLIERHQPWRLAHLRRDLRQIRVMRYPCRGAYFAEHRACMVELTFLARRDIGPATVASTIVHEGMHARVDRSVPGTRPEPRPRSTPVPPRPHRRSPTAPKRPVRRRSR